MKVKTLRRFFDLKENEVREAGDQFEASRKRFDKLHALKFVEAVEEVKEKKASKKKKVMDDAGGSKDGAAD
jgi:hypothetical protein